MTITYVLDVSSSKSRSFMKLLLRWRGSLWKAVWKELLLWLTFYSILSLIYQSALTSQQREIFENVSSYAKKFADQIPITFMLGFYVALIVNRWWDMFNNIGWIDEAALRLAAFVPGNDDQRRMVRRNCIRYLVLSQAMVFREISTPVRQRFPTEATLITAGLMTEPEKAAMDSVVSPHTKNYLPIQWAMAILRQVKDEGLILKDLYDKLESFRCCLHKLSRYDWVPIPLVYTQVVFLIVRSYFLTALMGRQCIDPSGDERRKELDYKGPADYYFPILSIIEFIFYVGWMKVAEALLNPFGDDDDDFEVNYMIDRNWQVGLTIVDDANEKVPVQVKDKFWEDKTPELLYTEETVHRPDNPLVGSAVEIDLPAAKQEKIRMFRKTLTMRTTGRSGSHQSDGILSAEMPSTPNRQSKRILKRQFSQESLKSPPFSPSAAAENGDLSPPSHRFTASDTDRKQLSTDWKSIPSPMTNSEGESDGLLSSKTLEVVSEEEEIDKNNQKVIKQSVINQHTSNEHDQHSSVYL